jgi:hypothetical protein
MRPLFALALVALPACGMSYTLTEEEGVAVAQAAFQRHGVNPGSTRPFGPVVIDEVSVDFTVDRWSLADGLGFEYVSEADPDFAEAATDLGANDQHARLQTAVDEALAVDEPGVQLLILRTWGHQTYELAVDQLDGYVDAWLVERGR